LSQEKKNEGGEESRKWKASKDISTKRGDRKKLKGKIGRLKKTEIC